MSADPEEQSPLLKLRCEDLPDEVIESGDHSLILKIIKKKKLKLVKKWNVVDEETETRVDGSI